MFRSFLLAPFISATDSSPSHLSYFFWEFLMKQFIHLVILKIWEYQKKCWRYHFFSTLVLSKDGNNALSFLLQDFFIELDFSLGHSSSLCFNQDGPSQQLELKKTLKVHSQEGSSAGLTTHGTCVHPFFQVRLRISFMWLLTNVPQYFL
jgi:hypothetical protein